MDFTPTYLYIKQHKTTGLKYFGKTTNEVTSYKGSGVHWKRHLAKHGDDIETIWSQLFTDEESLVTYALAFSEVNDIVNSDEWANLIVENGLDGAPAGHEGHKFTDEQIARMSASSSERWAEDGYRDRLSQAHKDRWANNPELAERQSQRLKDEYWTDERKASHSEKMKARVTDELKAKTSEFFSNMERTDEHCARISQALKGKPKTAEHKAKLSVPRPRVCRISDRKEMSDSHFNRQS
jgi:hypothetical protein